jgi:hypothetical protein
MPARNYDRYSYPAGILPGFNPEHPAVRGIVYVSAVARGAAGFAGAFINIMNGRISVRSGAQVTDSIDGKIGPYHITGSFNSETLNGSFPGSVAYPTGTMAAIMRIGTAASFTVTAHILNVMGGQWMKIEQTTGNFSLEFPASVSPYGANANFNLVFEAPYFLFTSWNPVQVDFVARNLETGQVFHTFNTPGVSAPHTSDGNFTIGCDGSGGGNSTTRIAAVMFQSGYCPGGLGLAWAEDPWTFWYPRRIHVRKVKGAAFVLELLRPDADDSISDWTDEADGTVNIFNSIDETAFSDSDYIKSPVPAGTTARFRLSNPTTGKVLVDPVIIRYRFKKTTADDQELVVSLKQNTTLIATWTHTGGGLTESFQTAEQTLSAGELATITDFDALFIEFQANAP